MAQTIKVLSINPLTHDVLRIVTEKPAAFTFNTGQAADLAIHKPGWETELRPFTFTSLPEDDYLEFTIKVYPSHKGVTNQLLTLAKGDELLLHDAFGDISYKGEGLFIAGGAGVTPFLAILRSLEKENQVGNNKLIFANKTKADIIHEATFHKLLGKAFINILSDEEYPGYEHGHISAEMIKKQVDNHTLSFYLCGPEPMMQTVEAHLASLGIADSAIVKEAF